MCRVHAPVFVLFCFPWKENKPKANTACISTSATVETSNSPGQEGFPVGPNVHVQGQRRQLRAERAESTAERGVGGPRGEDPALGPALPALLKAGVLRHPNPTFEASRGGGSLEVTQWEEQDLNPEFLPPSAVVQRQSWGSAPGSMLCPQLQRWGKE